MTIRITALDDVFDGSANLAPWVIVRVPSADVLKRNGLPVTLGEDGLDGFFAAPLTISDRAGERVKFMLWRHDGNPDNAFAIHLPSDVQDGPALVSAIMQELDLPENAVIWRAWNAEPQDGSGESNDRLVA